MDLVGLPGQHQEIVHRAEQKKPGYGVQHRTRAAEDAHTSHHCGRDRLEVETLTDIGARRPPTATRAPRPQTPRTLRLGRKLPFARAG